VKTGKMSMRGLLLFMVVMVGLAGSSFASALGYCNTLGHEASQNQSYYQPFNSYRGQIAVTGTGNAPSITLPTLSTAFKALRIDFQNRNDFLFCLDGGTPNDCGTNPPTGTVSNTAWVFKQASVLVQAINPISGTAVVIPTTMYVSGSTAGTVGFSMCGVQ
jgi:hypothetical protein